MSAGASDKKRDRYKEAGVDIAAGEAFVERIRPAIEATYSSAVTGAFGHYGARYSLRSLGTDKIQLVSGTDGVGTKLDLTRLTGQWERIGQDLVAMCANDILCLGARPLFFLDYLATSRLEPEPAAAIVTGIARACELISCSLIGGETAEMPGLYQPGHFDLAGFIVGWVKDDRVIDGSRIELGDRVLGLPSSGFHSNGYTLLRRIIAEKKLELERALPGEAETLGEQLTRPTRLYGPHLEGLLDHPGLHGLAHITGGGLIGNLPRILPEASRIVLDRQKWERPSFMSTLQDLGKISDAEMVRTFNDGIGMVLVVHAKDAAGITQHLEAAGETVYHLADVGPRGPGESAVTLK